MSTYEATRPNRGARGRVEIRGTMEAGGAQEAVTSAELRETERGFILMLRGKGFPRGWIEEHAPELLAQAHKEYAERLADGREDTPVGLMIVIAYRRALNLLDSQGRRPTHKPIESILHVADEVSPDPEQEAIERDRERRLAEAMRHLSEKERRLMAMVYFEGRTVRAAGRALGWGKSAADKHHRTALKRLRPFLGEPGLWSPQTLVAIWVAAESERLTGAGGGIRHILGEPLLFISQRLAELWRRAWPLAESGNAVAAGGAGRGVAATCVGLVLCGGLGGAATGVIGPGITGAPDLQGPEPAERSRAALQVEARPVSSQVQESAPVGPPVPSQPASGENSGHAGVSDMRTAAPARAVVPARGRARPTTRASTPQTVGEFGVEQGSYSSPESSAPPESPDSSGFAPSSAAQSSPAAPSAPKGGSSVSSEFGF